MKTQHKLSPITSHSLLLPCIGLLVLTLALTILAYQSPLPLRVQLGNADPFLTRGFYGVEEDKGEVYRWTAGDGIVTFPHIGRTPSLAMSLRASAWRWNDKIFTATVTANGQVIGTIPKANWRNWQFTISDPAILNAEQLEIGFHSEPFTFSELYPDSSDTRRLGIAVAWVEIQSQSLPMDAWHNMAAPSLWMILVSCSYVVGAYLLARALRLNAPLSFCLALGVLAFVCGQIVLNRIGVIPPAVAVTWAVGVTALAKGMASKNTGMAENVTPRRATTWLVPAAIVLVALGLRVYASGLIPPEHDDTVYQQAIEYYAQAMQDGRWSEVVTYNSNLGHPIFFELLYAVTLIARDTFGVPLSNQSALRLLAAAFGALQAGLLALINPLAGWFIAIQTTEVKYTSMAYLEALPALTSVVAMLAYEKFRRTSRRTWLIVSAIALGMTGASKFIYLTAGFAIAIFLIWEQRYNLRAILVYGVTAGLAFIICNPFLWADPIGRFVYMLTFHLTNSQSSFVQWSARPWYYGLFILARPTFLILPPVQDQPPAFFIDLDFWIYIAGMLGLPSLARRSPLSGMWLIVGVIFLLFWGAKWEQYALIIAAPLCLSAAYGISDFVPWLIDTSRAALGRLHPAQKGESQ